MSQDWPLVTLGEILKKSEEWIDIEPDRQYQQVTVRLWGKGVTLRDLVLGAEIAATRRQVVRASQFILSRIDARNGAFGLVPGTLNGAVVSNDFPAFHLNCSLVVPEFLEWMSKTNNFVDLCKAASEGTTNRVRLVENKFLRMTVPLPPLAEQRRIVARIEALAVKIDEARGLRREAVTDIQRLLFQSYSAITAGAPVLPMNEVAPLVRRSLDVEPSATYLELGIRSFGKGTFHKPPITGASLGAKRVFRIEQDDLLFNIVFAWEGAVAVAKPEDQGRIGSHRFLTCVPRGDLATPHFLRYHFSTRKGLDQLGEASPGGAGRNRTLGIKALAGIHVPIPPIEKQIWFDRLQASMESITSLQAGADAELQAILPTVLNRTFRREL